MKQRDISSLIDEGRWSGYQKWLVLLASLAIIFDGVDIQLLTVAIPSLMKEWELPRMAFANVIAAGLLGMIIGGAFAGIAGDRLGRKTLLLISVLLFSLTTMGMAAVHEPTTLGILRFVAGVGLGGALPNAAALVAEYVPRRERALTVTLTIVCVPIGAMAAGYLAAKILPVSGWRLLFVLGGGIPLFCLLLQAVFLAESPRFLARHPRRWPELRTILRRMDSEVGAEDEFTDSREQNVTRAPVAALFTSEYRRDTVSLWTIMFCCMLAVYSGFNWIPALLSSKGWGVADASKGIFYFNLGGVFGAIAVGWLIRHFGSKWPMLGLALPTIGSALVLAKMPLEGTSSVAPVLSMLTVLGGLINAMMVAIYALAANIYPTAVRATGVGAAVSFGRVGAVLSAAAGAKMLDLGGPPYYFAMIAVAIAVCFAGLMFVQRHIQSASTFPISTRRSSPASSPTEISPLA